jgi:hypothetical protein
MALTTQQLEDIRRYYAAQGTVTQNEPAINAAATACDTWILANRNLFGNTFTAADLTLSQRQQVSNAINATGGVFDNTQKTTLFNATAFFHRVIIAPPPEPYENAQLITAIRQHFVSLFDSTITSFYPAATQAQKIAAIRHALGL